MDEDKVRKSKNVGQVGKQPGKVTNDIVDKVCNSSLVQENGGPAIHDKVEDHHEKVDDPADVSNFHEKVDSDSENVRKKPPSPSRRLSTETIYSHTGCTPVRRARKPSKDEQNEASPRKRAKNISPKRDLSPVSSTDGEYQSSEELTDKSTGKTRKKGKKRKYSSSDESSTSTTDSEESSSSEENDTKRSKYDWDRIKVVQRKQKLRKTTNGEKFARSRLSSINDRTRKKLLKVYKPENAFFVTPEADEVFTDEIEGWKTLADGLPREEVNKMYRENTNHKGLAKEYDQKSIYEQWRISMLPLISMYDELDKEKRLSRKKLKVMCKDAMGLLGSNLFTILERRRENIYKNLKHTDRSISEMYKDQDKYDVEDLPKKLFGKGFLSNYNEDSNEKRKFKRNRKALAEEEKAKEKSAHSSSYSGKRGGGRNSDRRGNDFSWRKNSNSRRKNSNQKFKPWKSGWNGAGTSSGWNGAGTSRDFKKTGNYDRNTRRRN